MNVYFIDPSYVKDEAWFPLLTYLKVKAVYSFIPKENLPTSLYSIIRPYLKATYKNQDIVTFANRGVFWLRSHFEKHIRLITDDYSNKEKVTKEIRKKYSSGSTLNNIKYIDTENVLFLLFLNTDYNREGDIMPPEHNINELQDCNLPTHIRNYCLNILHKVHQHRQYQFQSAFIVFNEYLSKAYRATTSRQHWEEYILTLENGKRINFMYFINKSVNIIAPKDFPIIEENDKRQFTLLRTSKGNDYYYCLLKDAKETAEAYQEQIYNWYSGEDWQREVNEMNRDFWRECGEAGSNCDSWPGWD